MPTAEKQSEAKDLRPFIAVMDNETFEHWLTSLNETPITKDALRQERTELTNSKRSKMQPRLFHIGDKVIPTFTEHAGKLLTVTDESTISEGAAPHHRITAKDGWVRVEGAERFFKPVLMVQTEEGLRPYPLGIRKVTFAAMKFGGGTTTTYGIYHAKLYVRRSCKPFVDLRHAQNVAYVEHTGSTYNFDHFAAARAYATPEYPAFDFDHTKNLFVSA